MRKLALLAGVVFALMAMPSGASAAAWCAWNDPYTYNCGFHTYQQCAAAVSGVGGYCARNVYETGRPEVVERPVRRPRRAARYD